MAGSSIAPDQAAHELPRYAVDRTMPIRLTQVVTELTGLKAKIL